MKIDKIQCDICGKIVDYNSKRIKNIMNNGHFSRYDDEIGPYLERIKTNNFVIYGITKAKNINTSCTSDKDVLVRMEFDLCEECLNDLRKMISEWKKQRSEGNEFSS